MSDKFTLCIIGRPNVGKSTLFNRMIGKPLAIVHDKPGLTRDWRMGEVEFFDLKFNLMDTAGLEQGNDVLKKSAYAKSLDAISVASALLFVVDAKAGLLPDDKYFADLVRKSGKPVILLANKCEGKIKNLEQFSSLGFGAPLELSAEHGQGVGELYQKLLEFIEPNEEEIDEDRPLSLAIVGRPNAGKSTLVNAMLGYERMITSNIAGTTLDSIDTLFEYQGQEIRLIDTAGLRRKANIIDVIEKMAVQSALESVKKSEVVLLLIDSEVGVQKQDLEIASFAVTEGKALVVAVNKWDLVEDKKAYLEAVAEKFETSFYQVKGFDILPISAINKKGIKEIFKAVFSIYKKWNQKIATSKLNAWLATATAKKSPPLSKFKRPISLKYITQKSTRPPSFVLFSNVGSELPDNYLRYLVNDLKDTFDFAGVTLRFVSKKSKNPFENKGYFDAKKAPHVAVRSAKEKKR